MSSSPLRPDLSMKVPFMDLKRQYTSIKSEMDQAIQEILETTSFIGGPFKEKFEKEFAAALGVKDCIGVGNGTDSLFLILWAMKELGRVQPGDEIITAANSFISSSEAITMAGLRVRFVDIDPKTMNMDLRLLEETLKTHAKIRGGKVAGIMPVHLYGRMMDMKKIMSLASEFKLQVIEDTAQAHLAEREGKKAGTLGHAGSFSFYPGKNLGAYGDAGAVVTNDEELGQLVRKLANHGRIKKYDHDKEGTNSRLDTLQAAVLSVKLRHLPRWTQQRIEIAHRYEDLLKDVPGIHRPELPPRGEHVFHLYTIRVENRDKIQKLLEEKGVATSIHYPTMLPQLKAYEYLKVPLESFPVARAYQHQILSLPLFPEMKKEEQDYVVKVLKEIFR